MKAQVRNFLAEISRSLPPFKGKTRLGLYLLPLLTDYRQSKDCLVKIKMHNGGHMEIDLRSKGEKKSFFTGEYDDAIIRKLSTFLCLGDLCLILAQILGFTLFR